MASRKLYTFNLKIDKYGPVYNLIRGVWEQRVSRVGFYILQRCVGTKSIKSWVLYTTRDNSIFLNRHILYSI